MLRHIIRRSLSTSIPRTKIITTHPFQKPRENDERWSEIVEDEDVWTRYEDEVDVAIVGGGPSGLAAAIRLKQLANDAGLDEDFRVCVIEKAANIGGESFRLIFRFVKIFQIIFRDPRIKFH